MTSPGTSAAGAAPARPGRPARRAARARARAARAAVAALLAAAVAAVVVTPAVAVTMTYVSYSVGLLRPARPYLPIAAPAALLAASAALALARRRRPAAYLSAFAASYYLTLAAAAVLRASRGRVVVVPLAYNVFLVGPGRAELSLLAAALAVASAVASALFALSPLLPAAARRAPPEAERLARELFGASLAELRRRSPELAEAVEACARHLPPRGAGEEGRGR